MGFQSLVKWIFMAFLKQTYFAVYIHPGRTMEFSVYVFYCSSAKVAVCRAKILVKPCDSRIWDG